MTLKTVAAALVLVSIPALSFAMCSEREHQAQSCASGMIWDSVTQSCVAQTSS
ncbi:carbohydrate-binding module family 14 protein [Sedimentitalea todarodis]|uniref:Carbohydrate-binding module family 14 protein n=1 Tax=Sedimentitalea todarodis TaxID=1631240 RepID=A0ABU3VBL9_9RHOB|nr:carbohydrate-binding module family 14 protein [Sedimentitalea todarodis]MDU9003577.1 carbohydrate-binding module family 14 protein [Sedimentitalea todarodis]